MELKKSMKPKGLKKEEKMKRIIVPLFIMSCLCFASGVYSVTIQSGDYEIIETEDGYHKISIEDFGIIGIPGKPALPTKTFMIALPPGAEVVSIQSSGSAQEIEGVYKIEPAPMQLPRINYEEYIEKATEEYNENFNATYSLDAPYPTEIVKYEGMGNLRKWRFAYVKFSPCQYRPVSGKLVFYKDITIVLNYTLPSKNSEEWDRIQATLCDDVADEKAKNIFVNYQDALKWYKKPEAKPKRNCILGKELDGKGDRSFPYFIIIPDMTYESAIMDFGMWKASLYPGDTVVYADYGWIETNFSGSDRAEKIRNCLMWSYSTHNTQYALLIGDPYDEEIPMRYCYPDPYDHTWDPPYNPVPTDFYYADLTGNWDSDGDGYYGEFGQDAVDFQAEISVGRIPWSNPAVVEQILGKLINFEQNTGSWKKNALMLGAVTFLAPNFTDEARIMEAIKDSLLVPQGWSYTRHYEKGGSEPSPLPCEDSLCELNTTSYWSTNHYGYVNWSSHGDAAGAYRTINVGGSPQSPPIFLQADTAYLDDNYRSIVYGSACLNTSIWYWNLGQALIRRGSAGFIGASVPCWGPVGQINWNSGGNTSLNCYFALYMMRHGQKVGDALYNSKLHYRQNHYNSWMDQCNLFAFGLNGDPAMIWQGIVGIEEQPISSTVSTQPSFFIFPNPAHKKVTIQYTTPTYSKMSIKMYDAAGRLIKTIFDGDVKVGNYTLYWDGTTDKGITVADGVYFCLMESSNLSPITKKIAFIR